MTTYTADLYVKQPQNKAKQRNQQYETICPDGISHETVINVTIN